MKSNYKTLGQYIQPVVGRNNALGDLPLMGLSIQKKFIPSIANIIGTDMSTYRIIEKNQFAFGPVTSRNGDKITIALFNDYERALISQAYIPFEVKDNNELDAEYLMMWFRRPEFDRYARFKSHGSAREIFDWEEMCNVTLPVPPIEKQREIVKEYKVIQNRIALNQQLIQKLEETAQAIYKQWFVEFEFSDENGKPYKSNGGEMVWCEELQKEIPLGWEVVELGFIADKITDGTHSTVIDDPLGNFHLLSCKNIKNNDIEITDKDRRISKETLDFLRKRTGLQMNDLLLTTVGTIGEIAKVRIAEIPYELQRSVAIIRANKYEITHEYLYQFFKSEWFKTQVEDKISGSVQRCLFLGAINEILVLKPSHNVEQNFNILSNDIELLLIKIKKENRMLTEFSEVLLAKMTKSEETTENEVI
jgi:type I restriction enzyme S subunit